MGAGDPGTVLAGNEQILGKPLSKAEHGAAGEGRDCQEHPHQAGTRGGAEPAKINKKAQESAKNYKYTQEKLDKFYKKTVGRAKNYKDILTKLDKVYKNTLDRGEDAKLGD